MNPPISARSVNLATGMRTPRSYLGYATLGVALLVVASAVGLILFATTIH